jgi:hypothetical protein
LISYVEDLEEGDQILTGYVMTFDIKAPKVDLQALKYPGVCFHAYLIND